MLAKTNYFEIFYNISGLYDSQYFFLTFMTKTEAETYQQEIKLLIVDVFQNEAALQIADFRYHKNNQKIRHT